MADLSRVIAFIDGFNLYHSINDLRIPHLKWVNLWQLAEAFVRPKSQKLVRVYYFSAYAHWMPAKEKRHRTYVRALEAVEVTPIMASFKDKDRKCPRCGHEWTGHEEKKTDVNIAVAMLTTAFQDQFDDCLLMTRDADLTPAIRMLRALFPDKELMVVAPPNRGHSNELLRIDPRPLKAKIRVKHLERCLFPQQVHDAGGNLAATRPPQYDPPA